MERSSAPLSEAQVVGLFASIRKHAPMSLAVAVTYTLLACVWCVWVHSPPGIIAAVAALGGVAIAINLGRLMRIHRASSFDRQQQFLVREIRLSNRRSKVVLWTVPPLLATIWISMIAFPPRDHAAYLVALISITLFLSVGWQRMWRFQKALRHV